MLRFMQFVGKFLKCWKYSANQTSNQIKAANKFETSNEESLVVRQQTPSNQQTWFCRFTCFTVFCQNSCKCTNIQFHCYQLMLNDPCTVCSTSCAKMVAKVSSTIPPMMCVAPKRLQIWCQTPLWWDGALSACAWSIVEMRWLEKCHHHE